MQMVIIINNSFDEAMIKISFSYFHVENSVKNKYLVKNNETKTRNAK